MPESSGSEAYHHERWFRLTAGGVFWTVVAVFVALLAYNALVFEGRFSPDSIFYVDAAQNLVAGRGLSSSMGELNRLLGAHETLPKPMTIWGPLYPVSIALLHGLGLSAAAAALLVSSVFLFFLLVAAHFLVTALYDRATGLVVVALLIHLSPLRTSAIHAWSETMGLTFALGALYLIVRAAREEKVGAWRLPFVAGLVTGLAMAARFALMPLFLVGILFLLDRKSRRTSLERVVAFVLGGLSIAAPVLGRNLYLTGHAGGARWGSSQVGFMEALHGLVKTLGDIAYVESLSGRVILILLATAALLLAGLSARRRELSGTLSQAISNGKTILLVWPLLYALFLVISQTRVRVDPIDERLLLPAIVSLYIMVFAFMAGLMKARPMLLFALSVALVGTALHAEARTARTLWASTLPGAHNFAAKRARSETLTWLAQEVKTGDLLIAEDGMDFPLYLGPIDTVFFSQAMTPDKPITYALLTAYLQDTQAGKTHDQVYLVLRPKHGLAKVLSTEPPQFITDLMEGKDFPGIEARRQFDDGIVFDVDCASLARLD